MKKLAALLFVLCPLVLSAKEIESSKVDKVKVRLVENVDKFTGRKLIKAGKYLTLDAGFAGLLSTVELTPLIFLPEDGSANLVLFVSADYQGNWSFLTGEVNFLVNGNDRFTLKGESSAGSRDVNMCSGVGCMMHEKIYVPISLDQMEKLANAREADVRVNGEKSSFQGSLTAAQVAYFRAFVARFRELQPVPTAVAAGADSQAIKASPMPSAEPNLVSPATTPQPNQPASAPVPSSGMKWRPKGL